MIPLQLVHFEPHEIGKYEAIDGSREVGQTCIMEMLEIWSVAMAYLDSLAFFTLCKEPVLEAFLIAGEFPPEVHDTT